MMSDIVEHNTRLCLTKPQIIRAKADTFFGKIIERCVEQYAMSNERYVL